MIKFLKNRILLICIRVLIVRLWLFNSFFRITCSCLESFSNRWGLRHKFLLFPFTVFDCQETWWLVLFFCIHDLSFLGCIREMSVFWNLLVDGTEECFDWYLGGSIVTSCDEEYNLKWLCLERSLDFIKVGCDDSCNSFNWGIFDGLQRVHIMAFFLISTRWYCGRSVKKMEFGCLCNLQILKIILVNPYRWLLWIQQVCGLQCKKVSE